MAHGEHELVARARHGDRSAFEALVRLHADRLQGVVLRLAGDRHAAEEIAQETFLRAWRGIHGFKGEARFSTWLHRIGVNEAHRDAQRRSGARAVMSLDAQRLEPRDPSPGPAGAAEQRDLRSALEAAIGALEHAYRAPLVLRDVEGLSTAEAAAIMGLGEAAFKSRLHRARLAVRSAVAPYVPAPDAS